MSAEVYTGKYDASKLNNGNPDKIRVRISRNKKVERSESYIVVAIEFQTDYLILSKELKFGESDSFDSERVRVLKFLNEAKIDMSEFFSIPSGIFIDFIDREYRQWQCKQYYGIFFFFEFKSHSYKIKEEEEKKNIDQAEQSGQAVYNGKYVAKKLNNGKPDEISVVVSWVEESRSSNKFVVNIRTDYILMYEEFVTNQSNYENSKNNVLQFLNNLRIELEHYFSVPKGVFVKEFPLAFSSYYMSPTQKEWTFKSLTFIENQEKEKDILMKSEQGWFYLSENNVDLRYPELSLTTSQQSKISEICDSKMITLFEDYDKRYCIMYFELQPSSFLESMRFAFKQISSTEEYETIRSSKECRNCAMRVLFPIVEILSQKCESIEEEKLFDLIEGKTERICFRRKKENLESSITENENSKDSNDTILQPIQLSIPKNSKKCSLSDGKDGDYTDYKAYINCSFDTGKVVKYMYYQNSLTDDDDNYWQCPVPSDARRNAKTDIIAILKDSDFIADFDAIEKFKSRNLKTLILNR